jgi:hypothetical protein
MFIYLITNTTTGKIYVGQHKGNNLKKYLQDKLSQAWYELKRGKTGSHLFASMRKHPKNTWEIHPLVSNVQTREALNAWEITLIELFDSRNPEVGYNICKGGEGFTGPVLEETRRKLRKTSLAWNSDPANAEAIKARNLKLSQSKKEYYAQHKGTNPWPEKTCPACNKTFSVTYCRGEKAVCCSHTCAYQHGLKTNETWGKKREENRRAAVQSPEYRANHSKVMGAIGKKQKQASLAAYYANPKHCLHCASIIPMAEGERTAIVRKKKFCNRLCFDQYRCSNSNSTINGVIQ